MTDVCARMTDVCARCQQTFGYDCNCTEIERLTAERDRYKARAEQVEEALNDVVSEYDSEDNGRSLRWAIDAARATLAQIDAAPAEPRQPTVQEAARVLLGGFESPLLVALDPFNNSVDVAEDVLAALRALAEGESE